MLVLGSFTAYVSRPNDGSRLDEVPSASYAWLRRETDMTLRLSDYRFWVLFAALAVGVLAACSGDNSPGAAGAPDAMTQG